MGVIPPAAPPVSLQIRHYFLPAVCLTFPVLTEGDLVRAAGLKTLEILSCVDDVCYFLISGQLYLSYLSVLNYFKQGILAFLFDRLLVYHAEGLQKGVHN